RGCLCVSHAAGGVRVVEMVSVQQSFPRHRDGAAEPAGVPRSWTDHRALAVAVGLAGLLGAVLVAAAPAPAALSVSQQNILVDGQRPVLTRIRLVRAPG